MALSLYRASRLSRCSRKAASPGAAAPLAAAAPVVTRDRDGGGGGGGGDDDVLPWSPSWTPVSVLTAAVGRDSLCSLSFECKMFCRSFKGKQATEGGSILYLNAEVYRIISGFMEHWNKLVAVIWSRRRVWD